jgi:hypothetical protein
VVVSSGSPTLFVLSSLGDLVKFELFNRMDGFPDLRQTMDRIPTEGIRPSLPPPADDDKPKPRISLTKTTSLFPTSSKTNVSSAASSFFSTPAPKAPIAQSTPAPQAPPPVSTSIDQSTDSIIFPDRNQTVISHTRQVSHEILEKTTRLDQTVVKQTNQPPPMLKKVATKPPMSKMPMTGLTKQDLADLVADFEKDFEDYKLQNSKISLVNLDNENKQKQKKCLTGLIDFEEQARQVLANGDSLYNVILHNR